MPEFTASGFLAPLEELDEGWVTGEYEHDFLPPLMLTGRSQGRTFAVTPRPTWPAGGTGGPDSHPVVLPGGSKAGEAATDVLLALPASNGAAVLEDGLVALDGPATHRGPAAPARGGRGGGGAGRGGGPPVDRPIRLLAHGSAAICFGGSYEGPRLAKAAGLPLSGCWPRPPTPLPGRQRPPDRPGAAVGPLRPGGPPVVGHHAVRPRPGPDPGPLGRPRLSPHPRHLGCRLGRGLRWLEARADPYLQERG